VGPAEKAISQITTVDAAAAAIVRMKSSSYNSIQEYAAASKKQQAILSGMGAPLSPIILSASFRNSLDESLASFVFNLI
jgi:membrane carboxypeptidase/penicillin-binding protein